MSHKHIPVLIEQVIDCLNIQPNGIYVDGTTGGGGHSIKICESANIGRLVAIDRDTETLERAKQNLSKYSDKITFVRNNFFNIKIILDELKITSIDGALLDLGVSSFQLDDSRRGFSYKQEAPLDMRMDVESSVTAFDVVNTYSEERLSKIIFEYGEERFARKVARAIVRHRPINTTTELEKIVSSAVRSKSSCLNKHPARRTFQGIRIEVNQELVGLREAIIDFANTLSIGGVLCVISFHSLEDRIIKKIFADLSRKCTCPSDFPICICKNTSDFKIVTGKPIIPNEIEVNENPRSRSAKLRALRRIDTEKAK